MRLLLISAGAASMYCGSCMRDNALASALIRRRHDVTLLPFYTPRSTLAADTRAAAKPIVG